MGRERQRQQGRWRRKFERSFEKLGDEPNVGVCYVEPRDQGQIRMNADGGIVEKGRGLQIGGSSASPKELNSLCGNAETMTQEDELDGVAIALEYILSQVDKIQSKWNNEGLQMGMKNHSSVLNPLSVLEGVQEDEIVQENNNETRKTNKNGQHQPRLGR